MNTHTAIPARMTAATYTEGGAFAVAEIPVPEIGPDELLLRVEAASICGTDIKIMRAGHRKLAPGQRIVLGHEFAGVIARAGSLVRGYTEGGRVGVAPNWSEGRSEAGIRGQANYCPDYSAFGINCDGAHAEYVRIPAEVIRQGNITPLPDDLPWENASLAEPLSCVIGAQKSIRLGPGDCVAVFGCGPMGLLHIQLAAATGAEKILAIDTNPVRLAFARKLGATHLHHNEPGAGAALAAQVAALTGGRGLDAAITAAPIPDIVPEALPLLGVYGRLCLFSGLPRDHPGVVLDANAIHYKNLLVTGTTGGCNADYRLALRLIASGRVPVGEVISHRYSLSDLAGAYATAASGQAMKVVLLREP